jgi:hypothetical protein
MESLSQSIAEYIRCDATKSIQKFLEKVLYKSEKSDKIFTELGNKERATCDRRKSGGVKV